MGECWLRNPFNYAREVAEVGHLLIAWDRGLLVKKVIDPEKHAKLFFGEHGSWRLLLVGEQGTAELDHQHGFTNPKAVYPTWKYGESFELLEEMIQFPLGQDEEACNADVPPDQKPVYGQDHRVLLTELPSAQLSSTKAFLRRITELQEDYPDCKIHIHGTYSWRVAFGLGFASADVDPRVDAAKGKVILPTGKIMPYEKAIGSLQWINLMDMSFTDLKIPRNRCMFNIKSAVWAAKHFEENIRFKSRGSGTVNHSSPMAITPVGKSFHSGNVKAQPGDKIICNSCSLAQGCKYYREGAVCSVPGTDSSALAKAFQSRDSDRIIDGLGSLMAVGVTRTERALNNEEEYDEVDPEVTKMLNQLFQQGEKLAKLVNPALRGGTRVQVNVGANGAAIQNGTPNQLVASVIASFEARGIDRKDITPAMIQEEMAARVHEPEQITASGTTISGTVESSSEL